MDYYRNRRQAINYLNKTYNYSSFSQDKITSLAMKSSEVKKFVSKSTFGSIISSSCESNCRRIAENKAIAAAGGAVVSHIGCAAVDAIGIGAICHAAVITAQTAISDQAYAEMEQCIGNCGDE